MASFGGSPLKIQIVGHSFVTRLKDFIRSGDGVDFFLNLRPSDYLIQFSGFPGATVGKLREQLDVVSDFQPDIVFLLVGTNDLYYDSVATTAQKIVDFTDTLRHMLNIKFVFVGQVTYRLPPQQATRYPVDVVQFNDKVDSLNSLLIHKFSEEQFISLWKLKGFWAKETLPSVIHRDGIHLTPLGNRKLYSNIRAAVVSCQKLFYRN